MSMYDLCVEPSTEKSSIAMTSLRHDEGIEVISFHNAENNNQAFYNLNSASPETVRVLPTAEETSDKQKRVARIVMAIAIIMLAMSVLLVGVTLSMSDHIDDMGSTTSNRFPFTPSLPTLPSLPRYNSDGLLGRNSSSSSDAEDTSKGVNANASLPTTPSEA